ncbi:MAG: outer membrane beta-barrel protein [Bacteroidales bacterium]
MKKISISILLFLATILVIPNNLKAQEKKAKFITPELYVSLVKAVVSEGEQNYLGYNTSLYASFNFTKSFSLVSGLSYTKQRTEESFSHGHFASSDVELRAGYFSIPLMCRYTVGKKVRFFLDLGVMGSYVNSAKEIGTIHSSVYNGMQTVYGETKIDRSIDVNEYHIMPTAGVGVKVALKKIDLIARTSYQTSLKELVGNMSPAYINNFQFSLGIGLR